MKPLTLRNRRPPPPPLQVVELPRTALAAYDEERWKYREQAYWDRKRFHIGEGSWEKEPPELSDPCVPLSKRPDYRSIAQKHKQETLKQRRKNQALRVCREAAFHEWDSLRFRKSAKAPLKEPYVVGG